MKVLLTFPETRAVAPVSFLSMLQGFFGLLLAGTSVSDELSLRSIIFEDTGEVSFRTTFIRRRSHWPASFNRQECIH